MIIFRKSLLFVMIFSYQVLITALPMGHTVFKPYPHKKYMNLDAACSTHQPSTRVVLHHIYLGGIVMRLSMGNNLTSATVLQSKITVIR